jgi:hypothetical protein
MMSIASSVREVREVAVDLEIDLADSAATEDRAVALETAEGKVVDSAATDDRPVALETAEDKVVDLETEQVTGVLVDLAETNAEVDEVIDVGERAFNELPFVDCVH